LITKFKPISNSVLENLMDYSRFNLLYTLRKSLQTTSASPYRMYMILTSSALSATSKRCFELTSSVLSTTSKQCFELTSSVSSTTSKRCFEQPVASFLVYSLIFIEYYLLSNFFIQKEKPLLLRIAV